MKSTIIKSAVSVLAAFLLLWLCNAVWDLQYTFGYGDDSLVAAFLSRKLASRTTPADEEALCVNIAYDRTLVPYRDSYGIPVGEIDITDRGKLAVLLDSLRSYGNYRYIICDILFDSSLPTDSDSLLFGLVSSMPNIVVPNESPDLPDALKERSAPSGYRVFHHGEPFLKYRFLSKEGRSVPLKVWNDLTGNDIVKHWWGYTSDGAVCNNSSVLDFTNVSPSSYVTGPEGDAFPMEEKRVYHLGADILDEGCPRELFQDRIVLIGDFYEHDMHDTAIGQVPGILILYAAYRALVDGKNVIPWGYYLGLFAIFLLYCLIIAFAKEGKEKRNPLLTFFLECFSFATPLLLFNYLTVALGGFSINAVLIGSIFALASRIKKHFVHEKE